MLDIPAPADGVLGQILRQEGDIVTTGDVIAMLEEGAVQPAAEAPAAPAPASAPAAAPALAATAEADLEGLSPAVRRLAAENGLDVSKISGSGRAGPAFLHDEPSWADAGDLRATGTDRAEQRITLIFDQGNGKRPSAERAEGRLPSEGSKQGRAKSGLVRFPAY